MRVQVLLAVLLSACATAERMPPRELNATVRGNPGSEQVRASARALSGSDRTTVAINLAGGAANAVYPWHIHVGQCESNGPIVGNPAAYPALRPDSNGNVTATAALNVGLSTGQSYYINVHASPENLGTIIACGNLN